MLGRIRAGVIEQGAVGLLEEAGAAERLHREGLVHDGTEIDLSRRAPPHRFQALTGKVGDRLRADRDHPRPDGRARGDRRADRVRGRRRQPARPDERPADRALPAATASNTRVVCDYVAGCDGFHGVSRRSIPEELISSYERVYPFGWLGVLVDQPPLSHELVYVNHERGFALCSMRSATRSRYYLQCRLDEHVEDWPDEKF